MLSHLPFFLLPKHSLIEETPAATPFSVTSPDMPRGLIERPQFAGAAWGGPGDNLSPRIQWQGAPSATRSFAVTFYDPDAPTGSGWWHWALANIPASITQLQAGASGNPALLPPGALEINTDAGTPGYGGPLPPPGETHRYVITVTALDVDRLELPPTATPALMAFMMLGHTLAKASFTARGSR